MGSARPTASRLFTLTATVSLLAGSIVTGCNCDEDLGRLRGTVEVEPPVLDFGKVAVGTEKRLTLTIRNKGSFRLTIERFTAGSPFVPPVGTSTIGTGSEIMVQVGFRPPAVGSMMGTLVLETDDPDSPTVEVPLLGEGIEAAVRVEPLIVDFGEVLWNATTVRQTAEITVTNPGSDNFDLTAIEVNNDSGGAFAADPRAAIRTFGPGDSDTFEVSYMPNAMGPTMGSVRIATTADAAPEVIVTLLARAVGPQMELCAGTNAGPELCTAAGEVPRIDFGLVDRNGTADGYVRIINAGDRDMTAQGQVVGVYDEFTFMPELTTFGQFTVVPGQEQRFDVRYAPANYQFDSFTLSFGSNSATRRSGTVRVDGRVPKPTINVIPRTLTFSLQGAANRAEATVKVVNCGEIPLVLSGNIAVNETSGPAPAYSLMGVPGAGTMIMPGDCTQDAPGAEFTVVFQPGPNGRYLGEIPVASNDPVTPVMNVDLQGGKQ